MKALIKVNSLKVGDDTIQTVNARNLHKWLESKQQFSNWIRGRIEDYGFVENADYLTINKKSERQILIEYHISLDMAKEISMVDRSAKGKEARQYFISCEKRLKELEQSKLLDQQARSELKVEFRPMTDAVINSREGKEVKFYHFTTEADLINRIVFGCSSAKFKAQNDIEKTESLRDFLTIEQKNALISLQRANTVFLLMGLPYEERKAQLTRLYDRQHSDKLIEEHMRLGA